MKFNFFLFTRGPVTYDFSVGSLNHLHCDPTISSYYIRTYSYLLLGIERNRSIHIHVTMPKTCAIGCPRLKPANMFTVFLLSLLRYVFHRKASSQRAHAISFTSQAQAQFCNSCMVATESCDFTDST